MRVAIAQINPTVGDFDGNRLLIEDAIRKAEGAGADLLVSPELGLSGYPARDLLQRRAFMEGASVALQRLTARVYKTAVVVGFPELISEETSGLRSANSAALIQGGRVVSVHRKLLLPTYDVFDEARYFQPAVDAGCTAVGGRTIGISICEDIWNDAAFWPTRLYPEDPIEKLAHAGAEILINISASPFTLEKRHVRPRMLAATARRWKRPLIYVNQVGGQDDLVFDGSSVAFDRDGELIARAAEHDTDFVVVDVDTTSGEIRPFEPDDARSALAALALGTRDYARRCGFSRTVLGLSGGIDSALVACIAARALGPQNVLGVAMPSRFSSSGSRTDAAALAKNLGIQFLEIPIESVFSRYLEALSPAFASRDEDVTEENLQSRIRGTFLMALSNKLGSLLLTTANKSELGTGYCTLYGDMSGGLAVISDVPKTMVYELARAFNADGPVIPQSTFSKPPSAELRADQRDQDTLPPYEILDPIMRGHVEEGLDAAALVSRGLPPKVVEDVLRMVSRAEYKRRQAAPGLKITSKAFGSGRRYPIAHGWKG